MKDVNKTFRWHSTQYGGNNTQCKKNKQRMSQSSSAGPWPQCVILLTLCWQLSWTDPALTCPGSLSNNKTKNEPQFPSSGRKLQALHWHYSLWREPYFIYIHDKKKSIEIDRWMERFLYYLDARFRIVSMMEIIYRLRYAIARLLENCLWYNQLPLDRPGRASFSSQKTCIRDFRDISWDRMARPTDSDPSNM